MKHLSSVLAAAGLAAAGLAAAGLAACSAPAPTVVLQPRYTVVFLEAGPATGLSPAEVQQAAAGHRQNIRRLGEEGSLLLAGPFAEPRADPELRGLFVFDVADVDQARALAATDPAVDAGVLAMRAHPWRTGAPLRRVHELELEREARGEPFAGRIYVLGTAAPLADAVGVLASLEAEGHVAFRGALEGGRTGEVLFALVVDSVADARELLREAPGGDGVEWRLSAWFATALLEQLAAGDGAGGPPGG